MGLQYQIPKMVKEEIDDYVHNRREPGSFTRAVLENNLKEAFFHADISSQVRMKDIIMYAYWEIPGVCWGSEQAVRNWLNEVRRDIRENYE